MRVYQFEDDFGLENLIRIERPDPEPGPGEVLVDLSAATLNFRDVLILRGGYFEIDQPLPLVPLSDGVGTVTGTGPGVSRVEVGDRVCPTFVQGWLAGEPSDEDQHHALGGPLDGVLAEYRVLSEEGVVRVPDHLTDPEAAALPCAGLTAWNALTGHQVVGAGDTVLLEGTGGVSLFGLQFANLFGARTIVTSSRDDKRNRAEELGADHTINYETNPDWHEEVLEVTGGEGADHVLDVGGTSTLPRALEAAGMGAQVSVIGLLSGVEVELSVRQILLHRVQVQGIGVGSREDFEAMNRAIEVNEMHPVVDRVFPFEEAPAAFEYLMDQKHLGKVAIDLNDE